jgi:hypothetical protein
MIAALGGKVVAPDQSSGGLGLERPLANLTNLLPKQVKGGKVQTEHMFSGLHLKADETFTREEALAPAMERVKDAFSNAHRKRSASNYSGRGAPAKRKPETSTGVRPNALGAA